MFASPAYLISIALPLIAGIGILIFTLLEVRRSRPSSAQTLEGSSEHGFWTVDEIADWEKDYQNLREFWVILPQFLGELPRYFRAMVDNLQNDRARYFYFLKESTDIRRLKALARQLEEEVSFPISNQIEWVQVDIAAGGELAKALGKLMHLTNYFIANPYGPGAEGFLLYWSGSRVVGGYPLTPGQISRVVNVFDVIRRLPEVESARVEQGPSNVLSFEDFVVARGDTAR